MQKAEYSVLEIREGTEKSDQMRGSVLGPFQAHALLLAISKD